METLIYFASLSAVAAVLFVVLGIW